MSGKRKKGFDRTVYHSFAMIMQFGINMLVPICALSALGIYIDKKLGTSFVMILLFFAGALAGGRNVYRMAKYSMENSSGHAKRERTGRWSEETQVAEEAECIAVRDAADGADRQGEDVEGLNDDHPFEEDQ